MGDAHPTTPTLAGLVPLGSAASPAMDAADIVPAEANETKPRDAETAAALARRRDVANGHGRTMVPRVVTVSRAAGRQDPGESVGRASLNGPAASLLAPRRQTTAPSLVGPSNATVPRVAPRGVD